MLYVPARTFLLCIVRDVDVDAVVAEGGGRDLQPPVCRHTLEALFCEVGLHNQAWESESSEGAAMQLNRTNGSCSSGFNPPRLVRRQNCCVVPVAC